MCKGLQKPVLWLGHVRSIRESRHKDWNEMLSVTDSWKRKKLVSDLLTNNLNMILRRLPWLPLNRTSWSYSWNTEDQVQDLIVKWQNHRESWVLLLANLRWQSQCSDRERGELRSGIRTEREPLGPSWDSSRPQILCLGPLWSPLITASDAYFLSYFYRC